ncbi:MAG: aminopeptidase P family protein [Bacteroidales bacterium]|nr:aminopeptidase P family protein [Bacteroidales bacterium]
MFDKQIYVNRRLNLRKRIKSGLVVILGNTESPMNYRSNGYKFRQDSNFLYFFGLDLPNLVGIIDIEDGKDSLYGDDFDIDDIIWMGPQPSLSELGERVGVLSTAAQRDLQPTINRAIQQGRRVHILPPYRPDNVLLLERLLGVNQHMIRSYVSTDLIKAVVALRSIKEDCEILELERAAEVGYRMHVSAMQHARVGMLEQELAGMLEGISVSYGYMPSFPIILSQNGETLHNHDHSQLLTEGRLLLVDAGAENAMHYASDNTRTIPVGGKFTQRQKEIYNIVLAANNKAREMAKPGIPYLDVHRAAGRVLAEGLKALGLMKGDVDEAVANGAQALFQPHGLGHMMGLDVHDMEDLGENFVGYDDEVTRVNQFGTGSLRLGRRLQKGFVLTDEPGIYFIPALIEKWKSERINEAFICYDKLKDYYNFGGIRLEDDLLITDSGCRLIGKRIPITVEEVEATMAQGK